MPWRSIHYRGSRPVLRGNRAREQLQLDGLGNLLLAAKLIYNRYGAKEHWSVVREVADFSDGAYAAVAGGEAVDVSAALFPIWDYCRADSPAMLATVARLERDYSRDGLLYRRHLECFDARREGAFLAGTLWVAQYWVMRRELDRAEGILGAALRYANDLGRFAEEALPEGEEMLGNFPQAFVHAALIGRVVDLKAARGEQSG